MQTKESLLRGIWETTKMIRLRLAITLIAAVTSTLWHAPAHEYAHQLGAFIAGCDIQGISLDFLGPFVGGKSYALCTNNQQRLVHVAGPSIFLYWPICIAFSIHLVRRGGSHFLLLFPALALFSGGMYVLADLFIQEIDFARMVQLGVPIWFVVASGLTWTGIAVKVVYGYTFKGGGV